MAHRWQMEFWRRSIESVVDFVVPGECTGCGHPGRLLCDVCRVPLAGEARVAWPSPAPPDLPVPVAVAAYEGPVRAAVLSYKEHGSVSLAGPLSNALATAVDAVAFGGRVVLVPMPSSRAAVRRRGDDVVARLARRAARSLARPHRAVRVVSAMALTRDVADSAGLSANARRANLTGSMSVRPAALRLLDRGAIVLVDDVITTGATLAEAARALRTCGFDPQGSATVAATQRKAPVPDRFASGRRATVWGT